MPPRRRIPIGRPRIERDVEQGEHARFILCDPLLTFEDIFGFPMKMFKSFDLFNRVIHRKVPGYNLAVFRICFGIMLFYDILEERGLMDIIKIHGNKMDYKLPLFPGFFEEAITSTSVFTMAVIYLIMIGAVICFTVGLFYRSSCFTLILSYSFLLLKDRINWSNHSFTYLFVLCLMLFMKANTELACDSFYNKCLHKERQYPLLWNYVLIRFQIYFLLLLSAIKKMNVDWFCGFPLEGLSSTDSLFILIRYVIGDHYTNIFVVHGFGLILDFLGCYVLYFDRTRSIGYLLRYIYTIFIRIHKVGYFPYFCLISFAIFNPLYWPMPTYIKCKKHLRKMIYNLRWSIVQTFELPRSNFIYPKRILDRRVVRGKIVIINKADEAQQLSLAEECWNKYYDEQTELRSKFKCIFLIFTVIIQFAVIWTCYFYSVNNTWTSGIYGYAWDPMFYKWEVSNFNMLIYYYPEEGSDLDSIIFPLPNNPKWVVQTDTYLQLHFYVEKHFPDFIAKSKNLHRAKIHEIYPCLFISLNGRFFQRLYADISTSKALDLYDKKEILLMPLLTRFLTIDEMLEDYIRKIKYYLPSAEVIGYADFKGMTNYYILPETSVESRLYVFIGQVYLIHLGNTESSVLVQEFGETKIKAEYFCIEVWSEEIAYYAIVHDYKKPHTPIRNAEFNYSEYSNYTFFELLIMYVKTKLYNFKKAIANIYCIFWLNCYNETCDCLDLSN